MTSGSPAQAAGIQLGDIILTIGGRSIRNLNDIPAIVSEFPHSQKLPVLLYRNGKMAVVPLSVGALQGSK